MRGFLLVCALVVPACIRSDLVPCGDQLCPQGDMCISGVCASADQLEKCSGQPDGTACTLTSGSVGRCANGICLVGGCGNHRLDSGEVCDDGNIKAGDGCSGTCDSDETCGNGVLDVVTGESCDCGSDAAHMPASCVAPNSDDPTSACTTTCQLRRCGDGEVAGPEQCDGTSTVDITCSRFGYYAGAVTCSSLCQFDPSGCSERCGDHIVQSVYEACDVDPPENQTCLDFGYDLGWLGCTSVCTPGLIDCDRLGWTRVHPRVAQADDVLVRGNRMLVKFIDGQVSLLVDGTADDPTGTFVAIAGTTTQSFAIGATNVKQHVAGAWQDAPPVLWTGTPTSGWASDALGLFVAVDGDTYVYRLYANNWTMTQLPAALAAPRFGGSRTVPYVFATSPPAAAVLTTAGFTDLSLPLNTLAVRDIADSSNLGLLIATDAGLFQRSGTWSQFGTLQVQRLVSNSLGGIDALTSVGAINRIGQGSLSFSAPPGTSALGEDAGAMYIAGPPGGVFGVLKGVWQRLPDPSPTPLRYFDLHEGDQGKKETVMITGPAVSAQLMPGGTWLGVVTPPDAVDTVVSLDTTISARTFRIDVTTATGNSTFSFAQVDPIRIYHSRQDGHTFVAGNGGIADDFTTLSGFTEHSMPSYKLVGIDGIGSSDIYAAGGKDTGLGVITHFNGLSSSDVTLPGPVADPFTDLWVAASGTAYAVSGSSLYRGTASTVWSVTTVPGAILQSVSGTSDQDLFIAGRATFGFPFTGLMHWDGTHLYPIRLPAAGTPHAIHVTPGAVYVLLTDEATQTDSVWALVRATPW